MFKSIHYEKYLGYNEKTKLHSYQYKIIDSDFECLGAMVEGMAVGAIINVYKERNLNVAANLALYFKLYSKTNTFWTIDKLINYARKYAPEFSEYEKDLEKYLLLI